VPRVTVSIVNYRTAALTLACVESVLADLAGGCAGIDAEVVVVDNASGDGSAERIADWIAARPGAPVTLVRSPRNGGFAAGHNLALAGSSAEFVLLLNSDAELRPGCLAALVAALEAQPRAGIAVPRIEDAAGAALTNCFRFPGALSELERAAASGPVTARLARWRMPLGPDPDPGRIDWVEFSCALLRREMIEAVGPLDEGFFLYFEDIDYCRRAAALGWRCLQARGARALHRLGASGPVHAARAARARLPAYYYAGRTRYFRRAGGRPGLLAANAGWIAGRGLARLRPLLGKPVPRTPRAEYRDIWTHALRPLGPSGEPPA